MHVFLYGSGQSYFLVLTHPLYESGKSVSSATVSGAMSAQIAQASSLLEAYGVAIVELFDRYDDGLRVSTRQQSGASTRVPQYTYLIDVTDDQKEAFQEAVRTLDGFVHFQPNYRYKTISTAGMEPLYTEYQSMAFDVMGIPNAWQYATGAGIRVAVIDTGIYANHEEFCNGSAAIDTANQTMDTTNCTRLDASYDFVDLSPLEYSQYSSEGILVDYEDYTTRDAFPEDFHGHGTHVSGIVGASVNGKGISGVAYNATILPLRAMFVIKDPTDQEMTAVGNTDDIVRAINYAVTNNADIINMSLGGRLGGDEDVIFQDAVDRAFKGGVFVVAAAGNEASNIDTVKAVPAYYDSAFSVGSVNSYGGVSNFSNYGNTLDVMAVGEEVLSAFISGQEQLNSNQYYIMSGTSMAAPMVAGAAALILDYYRQKSQPLSPSELRRLFHISAANNGHRDSKYGYGIINVEKALDFLRVADSPPPDELDSMVFDYGANTLLCYPNPWYRSQAAVSTCQVMETRTGQLDYRLYTRYGHVVASGTQNVVPGRTPFFVWDGRDASGSVVPNGVYSLVVTIRPNGGKSMIKKHLISVLP
jgi:subtilisin family serine protease